MKKDEMTLANQLCFSAYNVSRLFARFYEQQLKPFGLTYSQYLVLLALWEEDNRTLHEIGRQLDLSSNTLTPLLKRLEQSGWVIRERSETDKRQLMVTLTEQAHQQQEAVFEAVAECLPSHFDKTKYNQAKDVLEQLEHGLKQLNKNKEEDELNENIRRYIYW
ncbi:MarR family winged helix-turn-helix transcriptional regulator [Staphylococcus hominis]|uniref:MarR family winged helix-turn-helix transcriptional regulator n=1 Tax=Staphylococcus hominis TaxID=1290 RepID=UPI0023041431|nr:MarR family transcriptional regulator [Staphylococcus hominis]